MESNLMPKLLKRIVAFWTNTKNSERQHVVIDGMVVLMTRPQARRYWELNQSSLRTDE